MNRRNFFNFLGAATLGTIIALKLPDTIAPIKLCVEKPRITFQALQEAYYDATNKGGVNPFKIILNPKDFLDAWNLAKKQMRFQYGSNVEDIPDKFMFMNAELVPSNKGLHGNLVNILGFGEVEQGTIETVGSTYGSCSSYKFI